MRFLVHGNVTPAAAEALVRHGHTAAKASDVELLPDAGLAEVLATAQKKQYELFTADASVSTAPFENPGVFNRTVVYLQLEGGDIEQDDAVDRLFTRYKRLTPGKLYTVTGSRVKVRQLPG